MSNFGESRLASKRLVSQRESEIGKIEEFLKNLPNSKEWLHLPPEQRTYSKVLSGETNLNKTIPGNLSLGTEHLNEMLETDPKKRIATMPHKWYLTGADTVKYATEKPTERYKFYMSLDTSDLSKLHFAQTFTRHLIAQCVGEKIPITSKTFDHD